jgi:acetyl-CoA C-acetyltransferase
MAADVDPRTPVIIGAAQVTQRGGGDGALDPIALAVQALRLAGEDSGTGDRLLRKADSARHVATLCWPFGDEAALIAEELGASPRETVRSGQFGGDAPQRLVSDTARAIADGQLDVAFISGAEAMATLRDAQRAGGMPDWPQQPAGTEPSRVLGDDRPGSTASEIAVGLAAPVYNYALLETALRADTGAGAGAHMCSVAELWSRFSEVAARNPHAQVQRAFSADQLLEHTAGNRPVSAPYPKLMTANMQVDQATGLILCSAEAARAAGVPRDRWVFLWAGAYAHEEWFMSERSQLAASPAIRTMGATALARAGVTIDEVAHIDLYSCFPSAVQIAARELGLATDDASRPLTLTGGLTFAGGPGNNYASHSIATLVARLREEPDALGLTTALGWYATKHACGIYSGRPPQRPFLDLDANEHLLRPHARRVSSDYEGPATLEAYTVPYDRDGEPEAAIVSALAPDGTRVLLRCTDQDMVAAIVDEDPLGQELTVSAPDRIEIESPAWRTH